MEPVTRLYFHLFTRYYAKAGCLETVNRQQAPAPARPGANAGRLRTYQALHLAIKYYSCTICRI